MPWLLAISAAAADAQAQAGKRFYCGPNENPATCGPSAAPGKAKLLHQCRVSRGDPLYDTQGRVMKGAGSVGTILGSPDAGMQAILSFYSSTELDAIAAWLLTLHRWRRAAVVHGLHQQRDAHHRHIDHAERVVHELADQLRLDELQQHDSLLHDLAGHQPQRPGGRRDRSPPAPSPSTS